jgi:DNA-3-methyladenine glycosylase
VGGQRLTPSYGRRLTRSFFSRPSPEVARDLLGTVVVHAGVAVRVTEVEAYDGGDDPASHAYRGETPRNAVMFGPPGHLYVYFTYGMHFCMNLVCQPAGVASAVLLRAGEVVDGIDVARERRLPAVDRDLARGPARLCKAMAVRREHNGIDVATAQAVMRIHRGTPVAAVAVRSGPRVGIAQAAERPWRFWIADEPTVSTYKAHVPRRRATEATAPADMRRR